MDMQNNLVHWVEPKDWALYRTRVAISRPVWRQLRRELRFLMRCYAFVCAFAVLPCLALVLIPVLQVLEPLQVITILIQTLIASPSLAVFITIIHWLYGIYPVGPERQISFHDLGITALLPSGQQFDWGFGRLCGWRVIERTYKGRVLQILLLQSMDGQYFDGAFALPDDSIRDRVLQILHEKRLPHSTKLEPSWEAE